MNANMGYVTGLSMDTKPASIAWNQSNALMLEASGHCDEGARHKSSTGRCKH